MSMILCMYSMFVYGTWPLHILCSHVTSLLNKVTMCSEVGGRSSGKDIHAIIQTNFNVLISITKYSGARSQSFYSAFCTIPNVLSLFSDVV